MVMTQISKYPLHKEIEERMLEIFFDSVVMVQTRSQVQKLLDDWISPTEKIMLAKRLSIAMLLTKGYEQRSIAKALRVGLETVSKVSRALQKGTGGYDMVISVFLKQEKQAAFWEKIDDALTDMLKPHHRNWSTWRKERWEEKIKNRKPY